MKEQEEFFRKVNAELEVAFENGTLEKDDRFQLTSSMGGRNLEEILHLPILMIAQFASHVSMYHYSARFGQEDMGNEDVVMLASKLTNMNFFEPRQYPRLSRAIVRIIFVIYSIIQSVLFLCAFFGFIRIIRDFCRKKIKLTDKNFLVGLIAFGYLILAFIYSFAISWFCEWLWIGDHLKFYSVGLVPMLMMFEIFGTYLFLTYRRNFSESSSRLGKVFKFLNLRL